MLSNEQIEQLVQVISHQVRTQAKSGSVPVVMIYKADDSWQAVPSVPLITFDEVKYAVQRVFWLMSEQEPEIRKVGDVS